jgi:vanillate O-demethylase ferredoxin subunit
MAEQLASEDVDFELHYFAGTRGRAGFLDRLAVAPWSERIRVYFSEDEASERHDLSTLLGVPQDGAHV